MRLLALDYGSKTIGVAVSDPLGITAQGVETIARHSWEKDFNRIAEIIEHYQIEAIVVGMPRNMNGSQGESARRAETFAQKLKKKFDIPIYMWDERLTTVAAEKALIEADVSRKKRKKVIDRQAAQLILQNYLDYQGFNNLPTGENSE